MNKAEMFDLTSKELAKLTVENERLRATLEDAVETLESMDMHVDNPLYERLRDALEQGGTR